MARDSGCPSKQQVVKRQLGKFLGNLCIACNDTDMTFCKFSGYQLLK